MATLEFRNNVAVVYANRKDFPAGQTRDWHDSMITVTGGFLAAPVDQSQEFLKIMGIADKVKGKGFVVVLNEVANRMNPFDVDVIIDHEVGHVVLGHIGTDAVPALNGVVLNDKMEIEADAYSAKIHGKDAVAKALKSVFTILAENMFALPAAQELFLTGNKLTVNKLYRQIMKDEVIVARFAALA